MVDRNARSVAAAGAMSDLRSGRPIVIGADSGCELVLLASAADTVATAFVIRYGSGFIVAAVSGERLAQLRVPAMPRSSHGPAFHVAVDAAVGVTTGISAVDRAHTLRTLADSTSRPGELIRPGHVMTARVDLRRRPNSASPLHAAAMACEAASEPGAVAAVVALEPERGTGVVGLVEGERFAATHDLAFVTVDEVAHGWYRCFSVGLEPSVGA